MPIDERSASGPLRPGAIFDLDGTIIDNSSERAFVRCLLLSFGLPPGNWIRWIAGLARCRSLADAKGNKIYLRGQRADVIRQKAKDLFQCELVDHVSPLAVERIAWHRRQGHYTILLSGSLELFVQLFCEHLEMDSFVGLRLEAVDGTLTGRTCGTRPYAEGKAKLLSELAKRHGLRLDASYGYGNHSTDAMFLEMVGHPVAVNPDRGLLRTARERGWEVQWYHGGR